MNQIHTFDEEKFTSNIKMIIKFQETVYRKKPFVAAVRAQSHKSLKM